MESIGERLLQLRKNHKLSQSEFAKLVNVARPTIAQWEAGTKQPSRSSLDKISSVFGVSIDSLMGKSEEQIIIDKLRGGATVNEIKADHEFTYKGKKLNDNEKQMFLNMLELIIKNKE